MSVPVVRMPRQLLTGCHRPRSFEDVDATSEERLVVFDGRSTSDPELARWDTSADFRGDTTWTTSGENYASRFSLLRIHSHRAQTGFHALLQFQGLQNGTREGFEASYTLAFGT